ncbi:helix-turn-helix transcriptional regulator [Roseovarius ramblicola]|uniref:Helix-turn-helix transcriptional regulator n=1 Tax=Roseovarius ramblicola TaxID=2022336 RepID=A0ABV5I1L7_9RHOB
MQQHFPAFRTGSMTRGAVVIGGIVLLSSMAFFGFDVVADILEHGVTPVGYTTGELTHLIFEMLAVAGLGYAVFTLRVYLVLLQRETERTRETIHMMRGNFDEVLRGKFEEWGLTAAERDVTLLIIKGLSVADLAAARNTAPGTIKAQSTSVFRKIGVRSKAELMSTIIDEFLSVQAPSLK